MKNKTFGIAFFAPMILNPDRRKEILNSFSRVLNCYILDYSSLEKGFLFSDGAIFPYI